MQRLGGCMRGKRTTSAPLCPAVPGRRLTRFFASPLPPPPFLRLKNSPERLELMKYSKVGRLWRARGAWRALPGAPHGRRGRRVLPAVWPVPHHSSPSTTRLSLPLLTPQYLKRMTLHKEIK